MPESDRCNHRINAANRLTSALLVGVNSAGKFGTGPIEDQDFGGRDVGEELLEFLSTPLHVEPFDDLHHPEHRNGVMTERCKVGHGPARLQLRLEEVDGAGHSQGNRVKTV
jgi:hypothetical protein